MAKTSKKKAETSTTSTAPKKEVTAKVSDRPMVEVVVKVATFGNYKKGDVIRMVGSTAQGCIDSDLVELKK